MTQTQSHDLVTRLRGLLAAATPGDLIACGWGDGSSQMGMTNVFNTDAETLVMECVPENDANLITEAVNALPALLDEIQRLQAQVAVAREALRPFARQNPHKREEGCAGILVPATISNVRDARAALASIEGVAG